MLATVWFQGTFLIIYEFRINQFKKWRLEMTIF